MRDDTIYSQENWGGKTEGGLLSKFSACPLPVFGDCTLDRTTPDSGLEAEIESETGAGRPTRKNGDNGGLLREGIGPKWDCFLTFLEDLLYPYWKAGGVAS